MNSKLLYPEESYGHYPKLEFERLVLTEKGKAPQLTRLARPDEWKLVPWNPLSR